MLRFAAQPEQSHQKSAAHRSKVDVLAPAASSSKLAISTPGDVYEKEADSIADQVMRMPEPVLQRACACGGGCPSCQTARSGTALELLQTKRVQSTDSNQTEHDQSDGQTGSNNSGQIGSSDPRQPTAPHIIHQVLNSPGHALDSATRVFMEPRFGRDFSSVRIHTDESAARSAQTLNAAAYTVGADIAFGAGRYNPASDKGRSLIAHELAHVTQQASTQQSSGSAVIARQTTEQYETKGVPLNMATAATGNYWEQKITSVYILSTDPPTDARFRDIEEKNAVLSVAWQMRPTTALTQDIPNVVTIPQRAAARTSQNLVYQITFRPRGAGPNDFLEILFVVGGAGATAVAPAAPPSSFVPKIGYIPSGFPQIGAAAYWTAHPDQERRVRGWIETTAPAGPFDQLIKTTSGSGATAQSASFWVKGTKDASGRIPDLVITFLGAVAPSNKAAPADYVSHDFADEGLEDVQTTVDPTKGDKLGTINALAGVPADEQASVKFAITQYFKNGTRNAEVDAIVPIAAGPKRVLYTFRFKPTSNDVDIQRIGEEGKDVNLAPQGELARVNGFLENQKGATEAARVKSLTSWLKKRYPGVTPTGATVVDLEKDVTAQIRAGSDDPAWFDKNYGIKILDEIEAATWLTRKVGHGAPEELKDLSKFSKPELQLLELVIERMSDKIVKTFKGLRMIRQKVFYKFISAGNFVAQPAVGGITIQPGATRTTIIFDAASANENSLFLGGIGPDGKAAVEIQTGLQLAHELGHTIANRSGVQKAFDKLVRAKSITPMTWYAASDPPKELFSESFGLYYSDPVWLKQNWPDLFNFFEKLDKTGKPPP